MRKLLARKALNVMSVRYDYDVSYMAHMLEVSPSAFFKFTALTKLAQHREAAPEEAMFAAKLVGALAEDCGPCVQLVVNMAKEAGMSDNQIEAVLTRDTVEMSADTVLGFQFADAVVQHSSQADAVRQAVRDRWGDAGVLDLTLALQIGRVFPMVKTGLGYAKSCHRVVVSTDPIDVVKIAA